jgi:SAM-dependent methyltransferase
VQGDSGADEGQPDDPVAIGRAAIGAAGAYGEAIADVYDDWYADVSDVEGTVAAVAALAAGGPVLELGIGTGRIALPLRAAGVEVHGVDASPAMVAQLRAKPGGDAIPVVIGDFARDQPEVEGGFAVAFAAFNTFLNLTSADDQSRCLRLLADRLRPGGHLVIETIVPADDPALNGVSVRSVEDDRVVLSAFRREGDVVRGSLISLGADGVRLHPWSIALTGPDELDERAIGAGFEVVGRYEGWREEPFDELSARVVTVYRRHGGTVPT